MGTKTVKTSINLPQEAIEAVRDIAKRTGSSMGDVIRQAIATEKYLQETTARGGKILIKEKEDDSTLKELLIRR
jgi:predicted DNA-binding protein